MKVDTVSFLGYPITYLLQAFQQQTIDLHVFVWLLVALTVNSKPLPLYSHVENQYISIYSQTIAAV